MADKSLAKVPVVENIQPSVNRYYLRIAKRYMFFGILFLVALILYIVCIVSFYGDYITYDNLKYLVRDFSYVSVYDESDFTKIIYNGRSDMTFKYFRGGLASVCGEKLRYYDSSGLPLLEDDISYSEPVMESSDKYLLIYDIGGVEYSIYNQLTEIISRKSSGRIISGDVSEDGSYIIVSRSPETKYVVELYNSAFSKTMSIYKDNYVLDASISPDGNKIVICSAVYDNSDLSCEIDICEAGRTEHVVTIKYSHTMPLNVCSTEDGFILLCDNGLYFFNYSGELIKNCFFDGMLLRYSDINEHSAVVVGSTNAIGNENRVVVFSSSGEKLYDAQINLRVGGAYASRNTAESLAYLKSQNTVVMIAPDGSSASVASSDSNEILDVVPVSNGAIICKINEASFVSPDSSNSESD